jgi:3-hydroxyisobutyrate dehydrogenase-like beta-hydroxyacid dehydrogenase
MSGGVDTKQTKLSIGFVGFGEVASTFAPALVEKGARVSAYDILIERDGGEAVLRTRAGDCPVRFCPLAEMVQGADYVLSTAATHVAVDIARQCAPHLAPEQVFVDLNSAAPAIKVAIDEIISPSGADYAEGAILSAVGTAGAQARILIGGPNGARVADVLTGLGLNVSFYSPELGKASTFKMLRSVFSKGLEALLIEFLVAGRRAGLDDALWDEVTGLMRRTPFEQVAANWVQSHAVAYERRYHEMVQVAETMRGIGLSPVMTAATEAFFERSRSLGLDKAFTERPDSMEQVIAFMEQCPEG